VRVTATALPEVLIIEVPVFSDARGAFLELYHTDRYAAAGITGPFVQDNLSVSRRGVLRGLHFQEPDAQGKLLSVLSGTVWDVAVDIRVGSPTFGRWAGVTLTAAEHRQVWVPPGFAHGFVVLSDEAVVAYKCTTHYRPAHERALRWDDPAFAIAWPVTDPTVSPRDAAAPLLAALDPAGLPRHGG
jgi:dTDP-4-dehydrorhamnose 3,5-epimerase